MGGEISAIKRPENSLLEEFLQFDHVTRQAPIITEEVTLKLEDLITQRIKDKAFDDVERKAKAKEVDPYQYKKKLIMEEAKSKQSLSQIYEQVWIDLWIYEHVDFLDLPVWKFLMKWNLSTTVYCTSI